MSIDVLPSTGRTPVSTTGWRELWLKEDWWAIWLGLGLVLASYILVANGSSLKWIAVTPEKWSSLDQLRAHFAANAPRYLAQFALWLVVFSIALSALGLFAAGVPALVRLPLSAIGADLHARPMDQARITTISSRRSSRCWSAC